MITKYKEGVIALVIICVFSLSTIHACITTVTNDIMRKMMIYNKHNKTFIVIGKGEKRRIGNQHQRAHFAMYVQQPNKPIFSRTYTCIQNVCSKTGNIQLRFSDIEKGSGDAYLFNITKNKPYTSMAQELPLLR